MKLKPLHDWVLVKRLDAQEKTAGGLYIPTPAREKSQEALVVAVGPGSRDDKGVLTPTQVKEDDKILFGKYSGTEIKYQGEDCLFIRESEIIGVIA